MTESELAWYDLRPYDGTAWCYHCPQWGRNCSTSTFCPLINADMEDALEFSERVAAKLAIKDALKKGEDIPGAILDKSYSLRVA